MNSLVENTRLFLQIAQVSRQVTHTHTSLIKLHKKRTRRIKFSARVLIFSRRMQSISHQVLSVEDTLFSNLSGNFGDFRPQQTRRCEFVRFLGPQKIKLTRKLNSIEKAVCDVVFFVEESAERRIAYNSPINWLEI